MNPLERGMWTVAKLRVIVVAEPRKEETKRLRRHRKEQKPELSTLDVRPH